jgi:hypothetical protein
MENQLKGLFMLAVFVGISSAIFTYNNTNFNLTVNLAPILTL